MNLRNREQYHEYDVFGLTPGERDRGLSALVRVHNEAEWLELALASIEPWCDEIVLVTNRCGDATPAIAEAFRARHPRKVILRDYPFAIHAMGPGHDDCPADSVHASAYYYNFTQALSTRSHVLKWDGDMVAMDWLGDTVRDLMRHGKDRIKFDGLDIAGDDLRHTGCHMRCPTNGVYKVRAGVHYAQGPVTQNLKGASEPPHTIDRHPAFLHFKWARKPLASATVQWPANWREIPHFQNIFQRRLPTAPYTGEYPSGVAALLAREAA